MAIVVAYDIRRSRIRLQAAAPSLVSAVYRCLAHDVKERGAD
jgi:hypothetical protein